MNRRPPFRFHQLDVFTATPLLGNPLAVVHAAQGLTEWVDNGPGWCAVMLRSAQQVLALKPDFAAMGALKLGVIAPQLPGAETQFEVRAFVPALSVPEDPVTGSLNAGLAQWLIGAGLASTQYVAAQGTALGRAGRVYVQQEGADVWVGGDVVICVDGQVSL